MPYIKQEHRPEFDLAIQKRNRPFFIFDIINDVLSAVDRHPLEEQDGCMNYALTKLFRANDVENSEPTASLIIITKYLREPVISYFNIQRALGLMINIQDEFERRKWYFNDDNGFEVFEAHKRMLAQIKDIRNRYEDDKIIQNGDL